MSFLSMANHPYPYEYMVGNAQLPSKELSILLPDKCPCCGKVLSTEILPIRQLIILRIMNKKNVRLYLFTDVHLAMNYSL